MGDPLWDGLLHLGGELIDHVSWLQTEASDLVVNQICGTTRNRPHPWSTASDYTSWKSLSDRTWQARQLPVSPVDPATLPSSDKVAQLFARPAGEQVLSAKSTCLFPAFAQYLTDGFIRTGIPGQPQTPDNRKRTSSNHEIDMCQLYGRTEAQTNVLRLKSEAQKGRLLTQVINGEEFSPFRYRVEGTTVTDLFPDLDPPLTEGASVSPERWVTLFAAGGDRVNSTPFAAMMNTLFLREHNTVAAQLSADNPAWDDERVFQTARNIVIPIFIKIVVEHYINHITPLPFNLVAHPQVAWNAKWNRPNWISAEFSLLYRWHSLMPDSIDWNSTAIPLRNFTLDNTPLLHGSLADGFRAASAQAAAELGARNTAGPLLVVEEYAIDQARDNRLQSYNGYRQAYGMDPAATYADISSDPAVQALLAELYDDAGGVDAVEFYPGLFAEDRVDKSPLPGLLLRMVAVDAFSQALTNPLLSEHVFNADTFTEWGLDLITSTRTLGDVLLRNCPAGSVDPDDIVMTQKSWEY